MSSTNHSGGDEWLQYYEQKQQMADTISDAVNVASSSGHSYVGGPTAAGRRPRVSRRAIPTTLLNANPSNFRALVQQFTGRSSSGNSLRRRGPVTLDFGSPTSTTTDEIFPCGGGARGYDRNYDHALRGHMRGDRRPRNPIWPQRLEENAGSENGYYQETMSYRVDQERTTASYSPSDAFHDPHHHHHHHGHDLSAQHLGNSDYTLDPVNYHDDHRSHDDMMVLEEFMMTDLDTLLRN